MTHHECEQYSDEWIKLRIGKPTASQFGSIITPGGEPTKPTGETRKKYKYRLVAERLIGQMMDDNYESPLMRRGSALEVTAFEAFMDHPLKEPYISGAHKAGFFTALTGRVGASPDGVIVSKGGLLLNEGLEIKCPAPATHVGYMIDGVGEKYRAQVQGQMWICGFKKVHFWSWHPAMPPFYRVIKRDDEYIEKLHAAVFDFCKEVDKAEAYCRGLGTYKLAEELRLSSELASVGKILEDL